MKIAKTLLIALATVLLTSGCVSYQSGSCKFRASLVDLDLRTKEQIEAGAAEQLDAGERAETRAADSLTVWQRIVDIIAAIKGRVRVLSVEYSAWSPDLVGEDENLEELEVLEDLDEVEEPEKPDQDKPEGDKPSK